MTCPIQRASAVLSFEYVIYFQYQSGNALMCDLIHLMEATECARKFIAYGMIK